MFNNLPKVIWTLRDEAAFELQTLLLQLEIDKNDHIYTSIINFYILPR